MLRTCGPFIFAMKVVIDVFKTNYLGQRAVMTAGEKGMSSSLSTAGLKGPKHDQIECGFFYINQTSMGR